MVHSVVVAAALQTGTRPRAWVQVYPRYEIESGAHKYLQVVLWYEYSAQLAVLAANGPVVVMPSWGAVVWGPERRRYAQVLAAHDGSLASQRHSWP